MPTIDGSLGPPGKVWGFEMGDVEKTICLGDEHDDLLRKALAAILREMGAVVDEKFWGVGGSQELEIVRATVGGAKLVLGAETYVGLTIKGEAEFVEEVARRVRTRLTADE